MTVQSVMHGALINGVGNKKPKESDQVIAGHGSLHRVFSFCTLGQAKEVGPGRPSYRISAKFDYY